MHINMDWRDAVHGIGELDDLNVMDNFPSRLFSGASFYVTYYICPCGKHLLYKIKAKGNTTSFRGFDYEVWNIFTCPVCRTFYFSVDGKRLPEFALRTNSYGEDEYIRKVLELENSIY